MTEQEALKAELARLQAENAELKAKKEASIGLKVSEKGAVSVYGLGKFPVTLYAEQWAKIFEMRDRITAFIAENAAKLTKKGDKPATAPSTTPPAK